MSVEFRSIQNPNDDKCAICLEEEAQNGFVSHKIDEKVEHVFHMECLTPWLKTHPSCPLCRGKVSSINGQAVANPAPAQGGGRLFELLRAAREGNPERIKELLQCDFSQSFLEFALINATRFGYTDIVCVLLEYGISDMARGDAILYAVESGYIDTVRVLLEDGPTSAKHRGDALVKAVLRGSIDMVRILMDYGPISVRDRDSAIRAANSRGHYDMVQFITERNHQLNQQAIISPITVFVLPLIGAIGMYINTYRNNFNKI